MDRIEPGVSDQPGEAGTAPAAVVFASKYGTTREIARRIADGLGGAHLHDLADGAPDLTGYDTVVLGTAVYAGRPLAAMTTYVASGALDGKRVALFVCGMEPDPARRAQEVAAAYPPALANRSGATAFLGGRFQFARMTRLERFIVKRIAKVSTDVDAIDQSAIDDFVTRLVQATRFE